MAANFFIKKETGFSATITFGINFIYNSILHHKFHPMKKVRNIE